MVNWEKARSRATALDALEKTVSDIRRRQGHLDGNVGSGAMWSAVLDEDLRDEVDGYAELRDREAPLIHGLIHARNGIMHAALLTTNAGGLTAPLVAPLVSVLRPGVPPRSCTSSGRRRG